jgi:hypothetical protein
VAEYLVNRYNVAAGISEDDISAEETKAQAKAMEKFSKSFFVIPLGP